MRATLPCAETDRVGRDQSVQQISRMPLSGLSCGKRGAAQTLRHLFSSLNKASFVLKGIVWAFPAVKCISAKKKGLTKEDQCQFKCSLYLEYFQHLTSLSNCLFMARNCCYRSQISLSPKPPDSTDKNCDCTSQDAGVAALIC